MLFHSPFCSKQKLVPTKTWPFLQGTLLRFLRARSFDPKAAHRYAIFMIIVQSNLCITRTAVWETIFFTSVIEKYMKKNLDVTKPHYSEQILPVPWRFVMSRFHFIVRPDPCVTTSCKRLPPICNYRSETPNFSQPKSSSWNFSYTTTSRKPHAHFLGC